MRLTYRRALEAQLAVIELNKLNLPIECCLEVARFSNVLDDEMQLFARERDRLVKAYGIKPSHTEDEDILNLSTTIEGEGEDTRSLKESQLKEFVSKFNELLERETPDWDFKIKLPKGVRFKPKLLKPIADFVEIDRWY